MSSVSLGDVCEVTAGQGAPQDPDAFGQEGIPFVRAGSLEALVGGGGEDTCEHISDVAAARFRLRLFPKNTILFAKSGMSATLGRIYRLKKPAYVVSHLAAVIPGKEVDPGYLQRWFERNPPSRLIPNDAYPSIRTSEIGALKIDLPKKEEQRRIATILDKADAIRRKRQQAILLANEFLRSVFLDMFGDPGTNPKGLPTASVEELLSHERSGTRTGPFGSSLKKHEYVPDGIPVWGIESVDNGLFRERTSLFITEEKFNELKNYEVRDGDILISRAGTVGRMCVAHPRAARSIIGTNLVRVALDERKYLPEVFVDLFVHFPSRVSVLRMNQKENAYSFLNPKLLRSATIPVPSILVQRRYIMLRDKVYRTAQRYQENADKCNALFESLSQHAFRGKL